MTLEITANNQLFNAFTLYWSVDSAYRDIVSAGSVNDRTNPESGTFSVADISNAVSVIQQHQPLAKGILNDWVSSSNYVGLRLLGGSPQGLQTSGAILGRLGQQLAVSGWWATGTALAAVGGAMILAAPGVQVSQRRCYPNNALAAIALAAEVRAEDNFVRECQLAEAVVSNVDIHDDLTSAARKIHDYLNIDTVRKRCARAGEYVWYYGGLLAYARTSLGLSAPVNLLDAIAGIQVDNENLGYAVALLHDVLVAAEATANSLKKRGQSRPFEPVDEDAFRMVTLCQGATQVQSKKEIKDTCKISRWTFSGRNTGDDGGGSGRWFGMDPWIDYRTPNERHPAIRYARSRNLPVQMGPTRTLLRCLNVARAAGCDINELNAIALALFAFWNSVFDRRMHMVHLYHFCTDCLFRNYFPIEQQVILLNGFVGRVDDIFKTVPWLSAIPFYETAQGNADGYPRPYGLN